MRIGPMLFGIPLLLLWPAAAEPAEVFVAEISGVKTTSLATGIATFTLRDDLSAVDYVVSYENLSSPEVASHVHRADGPIVWDLGIGNPKNGTWNNPTAADIAELRNEELYVNIHSEYYPTGEIRGTLRRQTVPAAVSTWGAIKALYR